MAWNPGQQLFGDRYIIERKLGEGGIGITYLAKNERGELRVIKTLRQEIRNFPTIEKYLNWKKYFNWKKQQAKLKQDFKQEASLLALCRHPHIVEIENIFDEGDLPCMVMEYIEGENLAQRIDKKGALPEAEALQYIQQIGEALILVHSKGLLHQDIKPDNIMIRASRQEAVLIDFGIARQFIPGTVQRHTESQTPGYAPPEQSLSNAERGEYIDVYALAATLYALVTGQAARLAFERKYNYNLKQPQYLNPTISDRVNEAIMKGMELDYKLCPQSVQEWLHLLDVAIVAPTQPVASSSYTPPSWECVHNIPRISGIVALSPKEDILASVTGSVIHLFSSTTGQLIRTLSGHSDRVNSVVISSDGQILASASWHKIALWSVATGTEIRTLTCHFGWVNSVAISSDGQILASADGYFKKNIIQLWSVATGKEIHTLTGHSGWVTSVAISSDGQILASGSYDNTIKLWEIATGSEIRTLSGHSEKVNSVAISSDGQILASGSEDNTIKLWEIATGKEICTLSHFDSVKSVAFSPDGDWLAAGDNSGNIKIWRHS
ncbi:serine/threonine-protein kinase [Nostoc sp.]|uniref:serine/threonine-protein kinase n=1 Tax=Nostoc sp. TaxID=1180 RepID=UPI002FF798C7